MKPLFILLIGFVVLSCSAPEYFSPEHSKNKLFYEYLPDQNTVITIDIIPTGDVELQFEDMLLEVNADYYNRYGIAIQFNLLDRQELPTNVVNTSVVWMPNKVGKNLSVFIVPQQYVKRSGFGYYYETVSGANFNNGIILGDESQTSRTLAHELGHWLGLDHTAIENNVMTQNQIAWQYDVPNDFNEQQIDTIMRTIAQK
jgi:hypothetical protein